MNVNLLALAPKAAEAESFLKALANRHRLMVLCQLHGGELSVTKLQEAIGLSQSSLSQHLARLREDKLVKTRREFADDLLFLVRWKRLADHRTAL